MYRAYYIRLGTAFNQLVERGLGGIVEKCTRKIMSIRTECLRRIGDNVKKYKIVILDGKEEVCTNAKECKTPKMLLRIKTAKDFFVLIEVIHELLLVNVMCVKCRYQKRLR